MVQFIKENGMLTLIRRMVKVFRYGQMVPGMMDSGGIISSQAMEDL